VPGRLDPQGRPRERLAGAVPRDGRILELGTAVGLPVVVRASRGPENSKRGLRELVPDLRAARHQLAVNPERFYYVYSVPKLDL